MTLENLYQEIGGNYANVMERLLQKERVKKFVLLFLKDSSHQLFIRALEQGDTKDAFRAVHTLKGVCMNLSFDALYQLSNELTEYLRADNVDRAMALLPDFEACYEQHIHAISAYADSQLS